MPNPSTQRAAKVTCPCHGCDLVASDTRYGVRHGCPVNGCTVVCWNGSTSTPADQETRDLRHKCHETFDPLWRNKTRWQSRGNAYKWLQRFTGLSMHDAHIGKFNADQCRNLLNALLEPS